MNCKEGDLAIITRGNDAGKIVTCIRLATKFEIIEFNLEKPNSIIWKIDKNTIWFYESEYKVILMPFELDKYLMPIRPDEIEIMDEVQDKVNERIY